MGETLPAESDAVRLMLMDRGYDGALVIRFGPGETRYYPSRAASGAYPYGAPTVSPAEMVSETTVTAQAALWNLGQARPVWHATTSTRNPGSGMEIAKSVAKNVVPELADDGLIPGKND
jgi:hypothetical protein